MHPRWTDAHLLIQRNGAVVAVLPYDGRAAVAAALLEEMGDGPTGWGALPSGKATTSGRCGTLVWTAGRREWSPVAVDPGPSWMTVKSSEFWIASGLADEAPQEWELVDGRRSPTGYHSPPLA